LLSPKTLKDENNQPDGPVMAKSQVLSMQRKSEIDDIDRLRASTPEVQDMEDEDNS
jgi:hypothetical protein